MRNLRVMVALACVLALASSGAAAQQKSVRMLVNLLNVKSEDVRIDMPVKLCWEKLSDEINFPAFEPVTPR